MVKPFISSLLSVIACIYSAFGVVLLTILGLCYQSKDPQFFHTRPLSEADTAALNCFLSALIFLVLFSFSYWQYYLNARMTPISQSAKASKHQFLCPIFRKTGFILEFHSDVTARPTDAKKCLSWISRKCLFFCNSRKYGLQ